MCAQEEKNKIRLIYILKAFAIFSVVCAHVSRESADSSVMVHFVTRLQSTIGTMGVPLFYLISGYLYFDNHYSLKEFVGRKVRTIIIPWIFCESIVWLYVVLRKGDISICGWFKFIIGVHHSTYYLSVLLVLYFLFWKLRRNKYVLVGSIILSAVFIVTLGWNNPFMIKLNSWTVTPYLNIINWMGYFALGMLIKKLDWWDAMVKWAQKYVGITCPLLVFDFAIHHYYEISWTYFSPYALVNIALQMIVVIGVSAYVCNKEIRCLMDLGSYSFTIYLLHELVVGIVVWITAEIGSVVFIFARPFVVLLFIITGIYIVKVLGRKSAFLAKWGQLLLGIR